MRALDGLEHPCERKHPAIIFGKYRQVSRGFFQHLAILAVPFAQYAMANDALLFVPGFADVDFAGVSFTAGYPAPEMKTRIVTRNAEAAAVDFI